MASKEYVLRQALGALVGEYVEIEEFEEYRYDDLEDIYGDNQGIADAAGLETAAEAKRAGRDPVAARKARQSFLRTLQRYATGEIARPIKLAPLLTSLGKREVERRRNVKDIDSVAGVLTTNGATVTYVHGEFTVSSDDRREREITRHVFIVLPTSFMVAVRDKRWRNAFEIFWMSYGEAYGIDLDVDELFALDLTIGESE